MSAAFTQGILIKARRALPPPRKCSPLKGVEHLPRICSEPCCRGVNARVCRPSAGWKAGARPRRWQHGAKGGQSGITVCLLLAPGVWRRSGVSAFSFSSTPAPLLQSHTLIPPEKKLCISSPVVWSPRLVKAPVHAVFCFLKIAMRLLSLTSSVTLYIPCFKK